MVLPAGEEDGRGVVSVESVVASLTRAVDGALEKGGLVSKARLVRGYADDVAKYCDPVRNPTAYRSCQAAAVLAAKPLLLVVRDAWPEYETKKDILTEVRVAALEALTRLCFNNTSTAAAVASTGLLEPAVSSALRPVSQVQHQQEHLAALQLVQAVAAAASEAPAIPQLLPAVTGILASSCGGVEVSEADATIETEGFRAFRAVRQTAVEVLVSCSLGHRQREVVAALLPEDTCRAILADASGEGAGIWDFSAALLFANLCDLPVPGAKDATLLFGDLALPLWARAAFADGLGASLGAALRFEEWPARSGIYHTPWKLASTCLRLALAGYSAQLRSVTACLAQCVQRILPGTDADFVAADDARAARLAVEVLLVHATEEVAALVALREQQPLFRFALREIQGELPAAEELLKLLEGALGEVDSTTLGMSTETASPF